MKNVSRLFAVLFAVLLILLAACGAPEKAVVGEAAPGTLIVAYRNSDAPEKEVVGETTQGTPIVAYRNSGIEWENTPQSSCFSEIGYDAAAETIGVVFRDSGAKYIYEDVPESVWREFRSAESIGQYYNQHIKGEYTCNKISD